MALPDQCIAPPDVQGRDRAQAEGAIASQAGRHRIDWKSFVRRRRTFPE